MLGSFASFPPCAVPVGHQEHVWGLFFSQVPLESSSVSVVPSISSAESMLTDIFLVLHGFVCASLYVGFV